jgi:voltage-gated potassium channel
LILLGLLLVGSVGYYVLEGWSPIWSFFSAVLVISTLGLLRSPETSAGVVLTVALVVTGVGTVAYLLSQAAETIIQTSLGLQQERRMKRQIAAMRGHCIVCGYGRVGRHAVEELANGSRPFLVLDLRLEAVERARADGYTALQGDATEDYVLRAAGIERAACLLITSSSDAANVFITLSARSFNPRLLIIARASEDSSEAKLKKAGADDVIAPESMGGRLMAALTVRPSGGDIADIVAGSEDDDGWLDKTTVERGSSLAGQRIRDTEIYKEMGATIVALRRRDGHTIPNPSPDEYIHEGDVLISVGARDEANPAEELSRTVDLEGNTL